MAYAKSVLYSSYGGFQLKASYQRNLLMANLVVIVIVAGLVASARLWGSEFSEVKVELPIGTGTYEPLRPVATPDIHRDAPVVKTVRPKEAIQDGSVWKPVADNDFIDKSLIYASEENYAGLEEGDGIGEVQGYSGNSGSVDEFIPPRDTFVPLEKQPEMIVSYTPKFPRQAQKAGISGVVWIRALIGKNGKVRLAEVLKSSGTALLDESAVYASYKNIFSPGVQNGRPVAVWVTYKVEFKLED